MDWTADPEHVAQLIDHAQHAAVYEALRAVAELRAVVRRAEDAVTARALDEGLSYAKIGRALGMTRQAVRVKHLARVAGGDRSQAATHAERLAQRVAEWEEAQRERERQAEAWLTWVRAVQRPT